MNNEINIRWFRIKDNAIIPTKKDTDAGFDIYTIENNVLLMPHEKHLFATGLKVAADPGIWLMGFDRGSTGSRGLHVHCGVIDNTYRGEIFCCINNDNDYPVLFTNAVEKPTIITDAEEKIPGTDTVYHGQALFYPTTKAILQLIPVFQPTVLSKEISAAEWAKFADTDRGEGKLGSSGKQQQ